MILITIGAAAITFSMGSIKENGVKVSGIELDVAAITRFDGRTSADRVLGSFWLRPRLPPLSSV
jgi:hypothetical protein